MVDRTVEFRQISDIYLSELPAGERASASQRGEREPTVFTVQCNTTFGHVRDNEELVHRMERLAGMKEFSNDPSQAMSELSSLFETRMKIVQDALRRLKTGLDATAEGSHSTQHYRLILQSLSKTIQAQVSSFKSSLQEHTKHVEERNKRVSKYGQGGDNVQAASQAFAEKSKYAMFAAPASLSQSAPPSLSLSQHADKHLSILRNRKGREKRESPTASTTVETAAEVERTEAPSSSSSAGKERDNKLHQRRNASSMPPAAPAAALPNPYSMQTLRAKKSDTRLRQAEQAEQSIKQMGQLFTQMASLVAEQSEVILRIEDDVEAGLANTIEGHKHVENVYNITQGNRGMILKIFALLIFFIFLFLVWT